MTTHAARFGRLRRERLTFGHGLLSAVPSRPASATAAALAHEAHPVHLLRLDTWDWGWGGLLLFSMLLFFRPQDQIASVFGATHMSDVAAIVGLIGMVVVNLGRRQPLFRLTPEVFGVILLGSLILATAPFSIWPGGAVAIFTDMFMQVTLIFLLMVNTVTSPKRLDRLCWVIVLAFGYISARVSFDYLRGVNLVEGNRAAGPAGGFFESPNDLALNLVSFLPLALMYVRRPGSMLTRAVAAGVMLLMLVALIFTKSRGGFVALVVTMAVYLIVARLLTPATVIALVIGGMLITPVLPSAFWNRMASITDASKDPTGSRQERIELMKQAWRVFEANPLTGIGAGQFENYKEPGQVQHWRVTHNTPLQLAAETGVFGVVILAFLLVRALGAARWTRRTLKRTVARGRHAPPPIEDGLDEGEREFFRQQSTAVLTCMIGWFVASLFASVAYNWTFYYVLGLCVVSREIVRARAQAYVRAKRLGAQGVVAA